MEKKEFEQDDPMSLTGMVLPLSKEEGIKAEEAMVLCFIEEYLGMGFSEKEILKIFKDPFYQAPYEIFQTRGEPYVQNMIYKVLNDEGGV
ncbi:MAG: hypothetical protein A3I11_07070 [Elusimicrobia bacterium RIFCSPLOWO2_02_FULL_39_32]|nr:MAG: hypothetical protein A3B80_05555 [Elusimicrobia bacterium RIFCSPHIGHO2_02_FULL_39_36]OGR91949.1 MAG: hypothetical protein A3I11_07070 [Elusimicrobia bacterium RIFCSPLOWO2_02_FULL_39_32]OGR98758.1 MAG: hypothetical protein A3G85_05360 [Elusimicrobia bacterium RIFCSPLOWO2_12_FULL_39_28]